MYIITGAGRGIGKFLIDSYIKSGHEVVGFYNSTQPTNDAGVFVKVNINNENEISEFVESNKNRLKNIVLLNTAGISYNAIAHKSDINEWKKVIETNVIGLFNVCRILLPIMREDRFGRIINFSSVVAQQGVPGTSAYATSKSALWGMTKSLSVENATKNITVNNINLGYFNIGMIEQVPENLKEAIINKIPSKRLGEPLEILSAVNFIVETPYFNGSSLDLSGGLV